MNMLLVIDIGNTQIAAGIYAGKELAAHWRLSSSQERTEDETWILMQAIAAAQGFDLTTVSGVAISSVVPDMTIHFEKMAVKYLHRKPVTVSHDLRIGLKIRYQNPAHVGADRICNAVGGIARYGTPLIIVDFGTATTFDVIDENGAYLGGVIAPGVNLSLEALHTASAQLPRVAIGRPERIIGKNTVQAMRSGIFWGYIGLIEGMIARIRSEYGATLDVVATGGLAPLFTECTGAIPRSDPDLTLKGLLAVHRLNVKS